MQEVELAPHQRKAVSQIHNGCILCGGTGVGKTRTALQYYIEKEAPRDVYVITTAKKRDSLDWETEAVLQGIGATTSVPRAGKRLGHIHVDSWNNISKYVDVAEAFFIFDEQRLVGSGAWVKAFKKIAKQNHWILLSATPGDTWLDYIPVFVANGFYKNKTEFLRDHVVYSRFSKFPKVEKYIGVGRLVKYRNQLLVEMPYQRHTTRHIELTHVDFDKELFDKVVKERWHVYENRPLRDVAELFIVMRRVVNSHPSRLDKVLELLTIHPRLVVFYNFDYELEALSGILQSHSDRLLGKTPYSGHTNVDPNTTSGTILETTSRNVHIAEWNGHKHESIPTSDSWLYLVQYTAGAEGWNCIETNACVMYSLNYSYRVLEQCQGRIDRLNTPYTDLYYYVLKSSAKIDQMIWRALAVKKRFNEPRNEADLRARNGF